MGGVTVLARLAPASPGWPRARLWLVLADTELGIPRTESFFFSVSLLVRLVTSSRRGRLARLAVLFFALRPA